MQLLDFAAAFTSSLLLGVAAAGDCPAVAPSGPRDADNFWFRLHTTGQVCCPANSVGLDPTGWYKAMILSNTFDEPSRTATVDFSLAVLNKFAPDNRTMWRPLQWGDLTTMHGRRIHISVVSEDLAFAWHVHVNESAVTDDAATTFTTRVQLPTEEPILRARMLFNYGVLAEEVGLCVDERASHVDPTPGNGRRLIAEGHAVTNLLTFRENGATKASPRAPHLALPPLVMSRVVKDMLPLGGADGDEIEDARAIDGDVGASNRGGTCAGCWGVRLALGELWSALPSFRLRLEDNSRTGLPLSDVPLYPDAAEAGTSDGEPVWEPVAGTCVGLNAYVRQGGASGEPARSDFVPYLAMGAHGIIARSVREEDGFFTSTADMWHIHLGPPDRLEDAIRYAQPDEKSKQDPTLCSTRTDGIPATARFGPSFVGVWLAKQPGHYAFYAMLKEQPPSRNSTTSGNAAKLLAPAFFFDVHDPPPTPEPTPVPSDGPTPPPSPRPSVLPSLPPIPQPSSSPSRPPKAQPTLQPVPAPSRLPSLSPSSSRPTSSPSSRPTIRRPAAAPSHAQPMDGGSSGPPASASSSVNAEIELSVATSNTGTTTSKSSSTSVATAATEKDTLSTTTVVISLAAFTVLTFAMAFLIVVYVRNKHRICNRGEHGSSLGPFEGYSRVPRNNAEQELRDEINPFAII